MNKITTAVRELRAKVGLALVYSYLTLFVANTIVIYLASLLFPSAVVLGTFALSPLWALMLSSGKLTLIGTMVMPLVAYKEWKMNRDFTPKDWMTSYFVVNTITLYVVTRFANHLGLGVAHWYVVLLLSAALDWAQGISMMALGKVMGNQS